MPKIDISVIIGIVGTFITLIGVVIAYRAITRKKLHCFLSSVPLLEAEKARIQQHTIIVDGQPAKNLIRTTLSFENRGNKEIEPSDFSETMPLRIIAENKIFCPKDGFKVTAKDPGSIKLNMVDEKTIDIDFQYIKPSRPISIVLLHDGELSVSGELKSGTMRLSTLPDLIDYIAPIATLLCLFIFVEVISISLLSVTPETEDITTKVLLIAFLYPLSLAVSPFAVDSCRDFITFRKTHKGKHI